MPVKEKPRAPGGWCNGVIIALPSKQRGTISTEVLARAQPVTFGGRFVGWLVDRQNGQIEAASSLDGSLGWFTSGQAALNALIAHAGAG